MNDLKYYTSDHTEVEFDEVEHLWKEVSTGTYIQDYHYVPPIKQHESQQPVVPESTGMAKGGNMPFIDALEEAFHKAGGVEYLTRFARTEPVEFMRTMAKITAANAKANGEGQVVINVQTFKAAPD